MTIGSSNPEKGVESDQTLQRRVVDRIGNPEKGVESYVSVTLEGLHLLGIPKRELKGYKIVSATIATPLNPEKGVERDYLRGGYRHLIELRIPKRELKAVEKPAAVAPELAESRKGS